MNKDDQRDSFYPYFKEPHWSKIKELLSLIEEIAVNNNKPIPHVALNWVKQQDGVSTVLVGSKSAEQAKENVSAANWNLTDEEIEVINNDYFNIFAK